MECHADHHNLDFSKVETTRSELLTLIGSSPRDYRARGRPYNFVIASKPQQTRRSDFPPLRSIVVRRSGEGLLADCLDHALLARNAHGRDRSPFVDRMPLRRARGFNEGSASSQDASISLTEPWRQRAAFVDQSYAVSRRTMLRQSGKLAKPGCRRLGRAANANRRQMML